MTAACESTEKRRVVANAELPMVDCQMQSPNNTTVTVFHFYKTCCCEPLLHANVATLANGVS